MLVCPYRDVCRHRAGLSPTYVCGFEIAGTLEHCNIHNEHQINHQNAQPVAENRDSDPEAARTARISAGDQGTATNTLAADQDRVAGRAPEADLPLPLGG